MGILVAITFSALLVSRLVKPVRSFLLRQKSVKIIRRKLNFRNKKTIKEEPQL